MQLLQLKINLHFSFLLKSSNVIGQIWYFSEKISNIFFSEHIINGFGVPIIIKPKQGKPVITPKAHSDICIVSNFVDLIKD